VLAVAASAPLPSLDDMVRAAAATQLKGEVGPAVTPPWTPTWKLYAGIATAGLGAVSLGASGYFGDRVDTIQQEYDGIYQELQNPPVEDEAAKRARYEKLEGDGTDAQLNHFVTLGAGGGLVAVGAALILWDLFSAPQPQVAADPPPTIMVHTLDGGGAPVSGAYVTLRGTW
jgi:hypothetical protein